MPINKKDQFLKVLTIELEDLKMEIEMMIRAVEKEKITEKISNYVFLENLAIFRDEINAVDLLQHLLDDLFIEDDSSDLKELKHRVLGIFLQRIHDLQMPQIMGDWIERKIEKAYQFIMQ